MKNRNTLLIGLSIAFFVGTFSFAGIPSEIDEDTIRRLFNEYESAYNSGDSEAIASLWDNEGDLFSLSGGIFRGKSEIESFFYKTLSKNYKGSQFHQTIDQIRKLGENIAIVDGKWSITGEMLPQGYPASGIFTQVLVQFDGVWRITASRPSVPLGGHTRNKGR